MLTAWLGALLGAVAPFIVVRHMQKRRAKKFEEQLPDAIDMIVNAMRAGFSFQAALKFCGDEIAAPLGDEFTRIYDEQRLGSDMRQALLGMQERVGTLDAKMLVTSLLIQRETGGNLSEVLGGLATLIRDRGRSARTNRHADGGAQVHRARAGHAAGNRFLCTDLPEPVDDGADVDHVDGAFDPALRGGVDRGGIFRSNEDRGHRHIIG